MFKVPNQYRERNHPVLKTDDSYGNNGFFRIPHEDMLFNVQASSGMGWEHVSVHLVIDDKAETPTWEEMCIMKDMFWDEEDCVVQYHPAKSEYVNQHPNVLHLWKPTIASLPTPPSILVGLKKK